ncbi:MAG: PD40 domain-containing protein [Lentisphaeria bacterium]|nr:hypothetical protein [Lentisphaeria bacterium]NQZ71241.1 PD40 domain-containing protein [Lentisphaeria bacterium]
MTVRIIILFAFILSACGQSDLVITKESRKQNPSIHIQSWEGANQLFKLYKETITLSDWFTLTNEETADYQLSVTATDKDLTVILQDGEKRTEIKVEGDTGRIRVFKNVDAIINLLFKVPGPCQTKIAFVRDLNNSKNIVISDITGKSKQITNAKLCTEPNWGNKNTYLSYTIYQQNNVEINIHNFAKEGFMRLVEEDGTSTGAVIANKSLDTAMILSFEGTVDLYTKDIKTMKLIRWTNDKTVEASPTWAPDDSAICFVSNQAGRPRLYTLKKPLEKPVRLTKDNREMVSPDWSKSNKLCFAIRDAGQYKIATIDMNDPNKTIKILSKFPGDWESPSWMRDGRHIVCGRKLDNKYFLYIVDSWFGTIHKIGAGNAVSLPACSK